MRCWSGGDPNKCLHHMQQVRFCRRFRQQISHHYRCVNPVDLVGKMFKSVFRHTAVGLAAATRPPHPRSGNYCVCDGGCTHTPCRTHIFLTHFPCVAYRHRVHAWLNVFAVRMSYLSISPSPFSWFQPPSLLFPDGHFETTFPTLTSAPSLPNCSPSESAGLAHFRTSGRKFGYLADPTHSTPLTFYEPKTCIDVNSEHTPTNYPSRRNRVNTDYNDITTTVAASETPDLKVGQPTLPPVLQEREVSSDPFLFSVFQQQAATTCSHQQASSSVVNPWLRAGLRGARKLVRGNESISSVEGALSR